MGTLEPDCLVSQPGSVRPCDLALLQAFHLRNGGNRCNLSPWAAVRTQWGNLQRALLAVLGREWVPENVGVFIYNKWKIDIKEKVALAGFPGFSRQWDVSVTSGESTLGFKFKAGIEMACDLSVVSPWVSMTCLCVSIFSSGEMERSRLDGF